MVIDTIQQIKEELNNIDYKNQKDTINSKLEVLYKNAEHFLLRNDHNLVCDIFTFIFEKDAALKKEIADALMPKDESYILDENHLSLLIEIEGMYSIHRLNLIQSISIKLIAFYDKAINLLAVDFDQGSKLSFLAKKTVEYYDMRLEKIKQSSSSEGKEYHKEEMLFQTKEVYREVTRFGEENLKILTDKTISEERKILADGFSK